MEVALSRLSHLQYKVAGPHHGSTMAPRLFLWPSTGHRVQGWFADNGSEDSGEMYEGVVCLACSRSTWSIRGPARYIGADEEAN